ncbi:MAG: hypothetical protein FWC39_06770 [Bacteroidetes bacterium]|nr:hypothetical protein [Bacteroidota bacterium]
MQVILLPEVLEYLEDLTIILYEKEYFSFGETSSKYVIELYDDITANLPTKLHKPAPRYFYKYGKNMEYAVFRKNKNTSWYVFFTKYKKNEETIYLIRYIGNNYTIAQYL